ncbi:hypothetical protein [Amycolatopsis sp. NPDC004079]|uniref:hypothetical protein n=1 Tax=Amycolatopsis sp. NPDC004079 TaxID=3154549 RepID=UPI0033B9D63B
MTRSEPEHIDWGDLPLETAVFQWNARRRWSDGEARGFTPWVRDHLDEIGALLGLNLRFVAFEARVGSFRADILARDETGRTVMIENQFGPTDHEHLGKVVAYAAHADAEIVVWIAAGGSALNLDPVRPEHRATLRYLNEALARRTGLCAIAVVLESDPGEYEVRPRMQLAVRPDEYPPSRHDAEPSDG